MAYRRRHSDPRRGHSYRWRIEGAIATLAAVSQPGARHSGSQQVSGASACVQELPVLTTGRLLAPVLSVDWRKVAPWHQPGALFTWHLVLDTERCQVMLPCYLTPILDTGRSHVNNDPPSCQPQSPLTTGRMEKAGRKVSWDNVWKSQG